MSTDSNSDVTDNQISETSSNDSVQQKKKSTQKKNQMGKADMMFMAGVVIMLGISGPYIYYTFEIYNYMQENY